jgi:hypothetical protein
MNQIEETRDILNRKFVCSQLWVSQKQHHSVAHSLARSLRIEKNNFRRKSSQNKYLTLFEA